MEKRRKEINNADLSKVKLKIRFYIFSIIALIFSFAPVILLLLIRFSYVFAQLFFITAWGSVFCVIGIIIGISSLRKGIELKNVIGSILSIISIIAPFGWWLYLFLFNSHGGELFL